MRITMGFKAGETRPPNLLPNAGRKLSVLIFKLRKVLQSTRASAPASSATRRGFAVEPIKGVVKEGEQQAVIVSFTLKEEAMAGTELGVIASFGVSQWAEVPLKCVLKGGTPAAASPETSVLLKGYIAGRSSATEGAPAPS